MRKYIFDIDGTILEEDYSKEVEFFKEILSKEEAERFIPKIGKYIQGYEDEYSKYSVNGLSNYLTKVSGINITPEIIYDWREVVSNYDSKVVYGAEDFLYYIWGHKNAYIVGLNAGIMRYSDDGEPGGTAGMPMMSVLKSEKVVNCCSVVVRYFGGILLGTGGLVRAYTQGCQIALKASGLVRMELSSLLRCKVSYSLWNTVQYLFMKMPVYIRDIEYTDEVTFILVAKKKESETVIGQIRNLTEGKIIIQPLSEEYQAWDL